MKYLLKNIACAIVLLTVFNCTTEPVDNTTEEFSLTTHSQEFNLTDNCEGENPEARVTNNSNTDVLFMVYDENAVKVLEIPSVAINTTTDWADIPVGEATFVVVNNVGGDKIIVLEVDTCMGFDLSIDANNNVNYTVSTDD